MGLSITMTNIETDNCLRKKASEYVIENDLIIAAPKSKIVTYLPSVKNQGFSHPQYPKINIDIQDLLDINTSDNQSIVSFYNKYGDLGLLSEIICKFVNPPIWLKHSFLHPPQLYPGFQRHFLVHRLHRILKIRIH